MYSMKSQKTQSSVEAIKVTKVKCDQAVDSVRKRARISEKMVAKA